ncbi:MAG: GNAT family N-acetyltransferase [Bacteroidota bacterium]
MASNPPRFSIQTADSEALYSIARQFFQDYQIELGVDLSFQDFDQELQHLPQLYGPPTGTLLLLKDLEADQFVGCVAIKALQPSVCEMKRLYVHPNYRSKKYGLKLVLALLEKATALNYQEMWLDTLDRLVPAIRLYERLGFEPMEPYYPNPNEGVVYMRKRLN